MKYNFTEIEKKWQEYWSKNKTFRAYNNSEKPKFYVLDMFPYPSGEGLHVGHPLGYIASDIYSRYKRLKGYNVLHPMGYDAFGLPAEQYAVETGQHPAITTKNNIKRYREQMDKLGFSYDWDREVRTCDPAYYKWTQWIFLQLFNSWYNPETDKAEPVDTLIKNFSKVSNFEKVGGTEKKWDELNEKEKSDILMEERLAYLSEAWVNWCPQMGTVLANEEVKDGVSERGGYPVERKLMPQWSLRITAYAERLLNDLEKIDWSDALKEQQRNWIGRSEGSSLKFKVQPFGSAQGKSLKLEIEVFTTRPDTIFGATFMVLAPEHELVQKITASECKKQVDEYAHWAKNRSERERIADTKKTGVFTGAYCIHPFTDEKIPIWIADYVLAGYGTGAVMAVPSGDQRDWDFAMQFGLKIIPLVEGQDITKGADDTKEKRMINSGFLNGMTGHEAIQKAIVQIEKRKIGERKINYRLRDSIFGRQRYWGEPIPIYYKDGIPCAMDENELPLVLPEVDKYLPTESGEPPLARAKDWKYKNKFEYEKTTMPGWAGSSWYYLRYMDAKNGKEFVSKDAVNYWQNVDLYIGGSEHATGHLLYVRFWTKFLYDLGYIPFQEPAKKLINQGMIQGVSMKVKSYIKSWRKIDETGEPIGDLNEYYLMVPPKCPSDIWGLPAPLEFNLPIKYVEFSNGKYFLSKDSLKKLSENYKQFKNFRIARPQDIENEIFEKNEKLKPEDFIDGFVEVRPQDEKMSKSKLNVLNPDELIEKYGADTLRMYEMFLGPLEQSKPWNTNGITGVFNFLNKFWRLFHRENNNEQFFITYDEPTKAELKILHKSIKKIRQDIENYSFNTAVSQFMICTNELTELKYSKRKILEPLVILISPFAPHIAEELWEKLGHKQSVSFATFPLHNEAFTTEDSFAYPISFNGKMRFNLELSLSLSPSEIENEVLACGQSKKYLDGKQPKKVIVVHKRIVNIVV